MMIEVLREAGLTDGEARVYLTCLETGLSTVGKIVDKSGVTKSIIYQILEKLIDKGLISYVIRGKTKHFQAAPATNILEYLNSQQKNLAEIEDKVQKLLPEIELRRSAAAKSHVTIYEGFSGIMTVYTKRFEKLKEGDEYLNLGLPATQPKHHHAFWQKDHAEREKRKIKAKLLYNPAVSDEDLANRNSFGSCDARRMPLDIETPSWVLLYKDFVVIAIPQGPHPIAIEVQSEEVTKSFTNYFSWLWEKSIPFKPTH